MAKKKNGKGAWIAGSVIGAVAGAAYALWKTPMSGEELRSKLAFGPVSSDSTKQPGTGFSDKVIGAIEKATAPIVGVELGKTANGTGTVQNPVVSAPIVPEEDLVAPVQAEQPTMTTTTDSYGSSSIRAKRFTWGEPAPDVTAPATPAESSVVVNEHVETSQPTERIAHVEPVEQDQPAADTYGNVSIRAQRFAWGDPKPATDGTSVSVNDVPAAQAVETTPTTTRTSAVETQPSTATSSATVSSADLPEGATSERLLTPVEVKKNETTNAKMHQFPKLGGLE